MDRATQTQRILAHLKAGRTITPLEAMNEYGCFRLSARIYDLKQEGYRIDAERVDTGDGAKVASYTLMKQADQRHTNEGKPT